jgi:hypothetical protein
MAGRAIRMHRALMEEEEEELSEEEERSGEEADPDQKY